MELTVSLESQNLIKLGIIDLLGIDRPRHGRVFGKNYSAGIGPDNLKCAFRISIKALGVKPSEF